jgi:hypothetical protein
LQQVVFHLIVESIIVLVAFPSVLVIIIIIEVPSVLLKNFSYPFIEVRVIYLHRCLIIAGIDCSSDTATKGTGDVARRVAIKTRWS